MNFFGVVFAGTLKERVDPFLSPLLDPLLSPLLDPLLSPLLDPFFEKANCFEQLFELNENLVVGLAKRANPT